MSTHVYRLIVFSLWVMGCGYVQASGEPVKKPESLEAMWKIIQTQQQQIDQLTRKLESQTVESPKVAELNRKTNILAEEVEKIRTEMFIPEEKEYKSAYGLGPAASKVYQVDKGLSIGGYGEANYQAMINDDTGKNDNADFERLVLYVGYKFTDSILFNSEIEFEHATAGEGKNGEVAIEFAALDFLIDPLANIRAGMILMPMGFVNQIHEPPFFFGNNRPEVERSIIPSTWREIGVGLFGELLPGLTYSTYVVNGMNAKGYSSSGLRSGRQSGSKAKAEDLAFVGRLDYALPQVPGLTFGGAAYFGNAGQNQVFAGRQVDAFTQIYEGHVQWKYQGLEFRALGSWGLVDDAAVLSADKGQTVGEQNYGWYAEIGYDILPRIIPDTSQYLAPFFRYEKLDTIARAPSGFADDLSQEKEIFQVGLQYKPIPNVVIKADYRNWYSAARDLPDDFNLGIGFIF